MIESVLDRFRADQLAARRDYRQIEALELGRDQWAGVQREGVERYGLAPVAEIVEVRKLYGYPIRPIDVDNHYRVVESDRELGRSTDG